MSLIFCVNVKPTVHCVRIIFSQIMKFPGFEEMELGEKFVYI